jgi:proteasome assembly chaperone (PAC2) family protein
LLQNNTTKLADEPARIASERDNLTGGLVGARVTLVDMAILTGVKGDCIIKEGSAWQNAEEMTDELARVASEPAAVRNNIARDLGNKRDRFVDGLLPLQNNTTKPGDEPAWIASEHNDLTGGLIGARVMLVDMATLTGVKGDHIIKEGSAWQNAEELADKLARVASKPTAVHNNIARDLGDKQDCFIDRLLLLQNNTNELVDEPARFASEHDDLTGGLVGARVTLVDMTALTGVKGDCIIKEGSAWQNAEELADELARVASKPTAVRDSVARDLGDKRDRFVDGLLPLQNNTIKFADEPVRIASERNDLTGGLIGARVMLVDMETITGVKGDCIIKEGSAWQNAEKLVDKLARVASERDRERDNMGTGPVNAGLPLLQLRSTVNLNTAHTVRFHKSHAGTGSCGSSTAPHKDEA